MNKKSDKPRVNAALVRAYQLNYIDDEGKIAEEIYLQKLATAYHHLLAENERLKEKRCEFCGELPQTENEKAYLSELLANERTKTK
jgi:hypothetical protein